MNQLRIAAWIGLALLVPAVQADDTAPRRDPPPGETKATTEPLAATPKRVVVYTPPRRGSPRAKIGGGVRGMLTQPRPLTLAPPHTALTSRAAPTLFWYLEVLPEAGARAVFTLTTLDAIDPLLEQELPDPETPGIQRVELAALGAELEPETEYQWSISIVRDAARRDLDLIDSSYLWRVVPNGVSASVSTLLSAADLAERSLWYEALEAAMASFEADPSSEVARADLEALLDQAGLRRAIP